MNRPAFYAALRKRDSGVFGTSLSQSQVEGTENLLNVWEDHFAEGALDELAYNLATAYHETAHTMQPITERGPRSYFDKYEPGTRIGKVLGNVLQGDGYRFRGEGHVQNTGRRNARVATQRLNQLFDLRVDLEINPEKRGDPYISALSLFLGNREGWWTGKALRHYLDGNDEEDDEDLREYIKARAVVNGTDRAALIGGYALAFEKALKAAGFEGGKRPSAPVEPPKPVPAPEPAPQPQPAPAAKPDGNAGIIALAVAALVAAGAWLSGLICSTPLISNLCGG